MTQHAESIAETAHKIKQSQIGEISNGLLKCSRNRQFNAHVIQKPGNLAIEQSEMAELITSGDMISVTKTTINMDKVRHPRTGQFHQKNRSPRI